LIYNPFRMRVCRIVLTLSTLCVAPATVFAGPQIGVDRVAWLQGCWQSSGSPNTVEEQWMAPRGGTMVGMGRTVRGNRTTEYELVVIREQDGRLAYEAHPSGQPSAVFLSREITDQSVVFENPEHDFPQRVGYRRADGGGLAAWIEGTTNGKSRHIDFIYSRAACAGN
jgi:uncharacterized protein DUF6265